MNTLQINQKDYKMCVEGSRLRIDNISEQTKPLFYPLKSIERIILTARGTIDSALILKLQETGIGLVIISPKSKNIYSIATSKHGDINRRILQAALLKSNDARIALSKELISKKIEGYRVFLESKKNQRHDLRLPLHKAIQQLTAFTLALNSTDTRSINSIRGIEGTATLCWFKAYRLLFPASFNFTNRNRRPPKDPINSLLSLSYSMLYHEAKNALVSVGLDPDIGYLHDIAYNRHSLACDKMEALRPAVDIFIYELIRAKKITITHFTNNPSEDNACYLTKEGKAIFYPEWKMFAECIYPRLQQQAILYVKQLEDYSHE